MTTASQYDGLRDSGDVRVMNEAPASPAGVLGAPVVSAGHPRGRWARSAGPSGAFATLQAEEVARVVRLRARDLRVAAWIRAREDERRAASGLDPTFRAVERHAIGRADVAGLNPSVGGYHYSMDTQATPEEAA